MNRSIRSLNLLTAVVLGAAMAMTAGAAPRGKAGPKTAQDLVLEQQDLMVRECKLSDDQQKAVAEKFKLKLTALAAWEKDNAEKVKAAEEAAKAARQGTDKYAKKTASDNLKGLEAGRTQATAEADKAILDVLTAEQKDAWAGTQLAQTLLPRYKKANLTDDQTAKIKSACAIAARELAELSGDDKKTKQGRSTVEKSLKWAIDNVILTPEQRAAKPARPAQK